MSQVTIPANYTPESREGFVTVTEQVDGTFIAEGEDDDLEAFVDDLCLGDEDAFSDIMRTIR